MSSHLHLLATKVYLEIPEKRDKLIGCLRTAYAKVYSHVKEQTTYSDLFDALRNQQFMESYR